MPFGCSVSAVYFCGKEQRLIDYRSGQHSGHEVRTASGLM